MQIQTCAISKAEAFPHHSCSHLGSAFSQPGFKYSQSQARKRTVPEALELTSHGQNRVPQLGEKEDPLQQLPTP